MAVELLTAGAHRGLISLGFFERKEKVNKKSVFEGRGRLSEPVRAALLGRAGDPAPAPRWCLVPFSLVLVDLLFLKFNLLFISNFKIRKPYTWGKV